MPDQVQRKGERAGGDAGTTARHDRQVERYPGIAKQLAQLFGVLQLTGEWIGDALMGEIAATGDMTTAQAGPGFGRGAVEAAGGARIDDLLAAGCHVLDQGPLVADQGRVEPCREMTSRGGREGGVERPSLGLPFGQAAIEDRDLMMPVKAQHPPGAPSRRQTDTVIDDDPVTVADTECGDLARKEIGGRDHVRQTRAGLRYVVDIEKHSTRDVALVEVLTRGRGNARQFEGRI